jgi:hypothetical protein
MPQARSTKMPLVRHPRAGRAPAGDDMKRARTSFSEQKAAGRLF